MWRRRLLCGLGMLCVAAGIASAAQNVDGVEAAWDRIWEHRLSPLQIRVVDGAGNPIVGAEVRAAMTRHDFRFGTAVNASFFAELDDGHPYRKRLRELFNNAVLENAHKWKYWERDSEAADVTVEWLQAHGFTIRGHTMLWQTFRYGVPMPGDVERALRANDEADRRHVRDRVTEHIEAIGTAYRGVIDKWEVVNEVTTEHEVTAVLNPDTRPQEAPELLEWFEAARNAAPDAALYVNDFDILPGEDEEHRAAYERLIEFLLANGAPLGGIGFQSHFHQSDLRRTPEEYWETLERFARFGLPLTITEFDMFGYGWGDERESREYRQANAFREFLITAFSHPAVTGFTMWGFWDGRHWADEAPLFREDWTPKPALDVYETLVFDSWWTDEAGETGNGGSFEIRGFHGDYEVTIERDGMETEIVEVSLPKGGAEITVELRYRGPILVPSHSGK
ncbi:MAG: endo-1,4-beta-xylanase [Candidatus Hydrogenedentota bacterium]